MYLSHNYDICCFVYVVGRCGLVGLVANQLVCEERLMYIFFSPSFESYTVHSLCLSLRVL